MDIFITGIGTLNSIGLNAKESLRSLLSKKSGLKWSDSHQMTIGAVPLSNDELISKLGTKASGYSRTSLLGIMAAQEAWGSSAFSDSIRTGLISSTSVGELDVSEKINESKEINTATYNAGNTTQQIADYLGFSGYVSTISTACSSGANAILLGARLIESGRLDRLLVGGVDPFCSHNINGFSALNICDKDPCKPFDKDRSGLNLAEGAGFLVLENEKSIERSSNSVICKLSGWSNTADAYHQTATSPTGRGAVLAMNKALSKSNLNANNIDYINAHGTGTQNNDLTESIAIQSVFGSTVPPFSSTKSFTGHALAGAGSIEAVFSVLAIKEGFIPANLGFENSINDFEIEPTKETIRRPLEHVLSNSFGFGGNCSSLIFSRS